MSTNNTNEQDNLSLEEELNEVEIQKPHIPEQKVSRFGNQGLSKFGKGSMSANPPMKQRPGRAAGRGR